MTIIQYHTLASKKPPQETKAIPSCHDLTRPHSTTKFKPKQPKTKPSFCYSDHTEPSPLERFLGTAYRKHGRGLWKSTRRIGTTLFYTLREDPQIVNISQLARDTGYSRRTVYKALAYFSRFGKIQRINERRTGKNRPCEYKLHDSFTEKQDSAKPQEKARCGVSVNSHSRRSLRTKDEKKNTTKASQSGSSSLESFKNIQKPFSLMPRDKRKLSAIARKTCEAEPISAVLAVLWQRNAAAGVWLSAIGGLQGLTIDAQPEEMVWRSRKAISGLIGGLNADGFRAIMLGTVSREEATKREVAKFQRRLVGLRKWRIENDEPDYESWYMEMKASLQRMLYDAEDGIRYDAKDNRIDQASCNYRINYEILLDKGVSIVYNLS